MGIRLLIAAGESAGSGDDLPVTIRQLLDVADEILVVTPALPGRFEWLASATDRAREEADQRLQTVLGQLDEVEADTSGAVGSDDPLEAIADAVAQFSPHHLLIAFRAGEKAGWQESGLLDKVEDRFGLPMTVFRASA
jgi:hypothetical protein